MANNGNNEQTFSTPSPGEILRQRRSTGASVYGDDASKVVPESTGVDVAGNPFRSSLFTDALMERGVMLAPLVVQWTYQVSAAKPFAKWIQTKDILLSRARLGINADTENVHYFGTYISQEASTAFDSREVEVSGSRDEVQLQLGVACQTLWGFTSEAAMNHMFDLCRGRVERVSIVENDIRDFVTGLKKHIHEAGSEHFRQSVLVASASL